MSSVFADYEDSVYEHPEFTPSERLLHLMEEHALTLAKLAPRAGVAVTPRSGIPNPELHSYLVLDFRI